MGDSRKPSPLGASSPLLAVSERVLVTGFGPFDGVPENPSGLIAKALHNGDDIVGVELPVSNKRSLDGLRGTFYDCKGPELLLGLGVHGEAGFRFEQQAGTAFLDDPDVDGESGLHFYKASEPLATRLEIECLAHHSQLEAWVSQVAGGYLCEWVYRLLLERAETTGCQALCVHVPPVARTGLNEQGDRLSSYGSKRAAAESWANRRTKAGRAF